VITKEKYWKDITELQDKFDALFEKNKKLKDDLKFAMSFAPKEKATKGLDPTFYFTSTYEGDKRLDDRLDQIRKELAE